MVRELRDGDILTFLMVSLDKKEGIDVCWLNNEGGTGLVPPTLFDRFGRPG